MGRDLALRSLDPWKTTWVGLSKILPLLVFFFGRRRRRNYDCFKELILQGHLAIEPTKELHWKVWEGLHCFEIFLQGAKGGLIAIPPRSLPKAEVPSPSPRARAEFHIVRALMSTNNMAIFLTWL